MYAKNKEPVKFDELDWNQFINLQKANQGPLMKIPFSINTPYLQRDFNLDLIIWNLSDKNMEITKKVVHYVLQNFNKLFETGWTVLYHQLCENEPYPDVANHTLAEFYTQQIDFESPYYSIQLEINSEHLTDGAARYCFVVSTTCSCNGWMISDDDMRIYMVDNKCQGLNTNNDDMQMVEYDVNFLYGDEARISKMFSKEYQIMEQEGFAYAKAFQE